MNAFFIYLAACFVILSAATYMILAPCYEDGILGKIGLLIMAIGAVAFILKTCGGIAPEPPSTSVWMAGGVAIFLLRHVWRFTRFEARRKSAASTPGVQLQRRLHDSIQ